MDKETKKMLQAVLNGQNALVAELQSVKKDVQLLKKDMNTVKIELRNVKKKIDRNHKELTQRIDAIGKQSAYLEDDCPTRDEFDAVEKRVRKLEMKQAFASA